MANESLGMGATLGYSTTGGAPYTTIARLESIGDFSFGAVEDVRFVCYDNADGYAEHLPGILDAGEFDFTGIWTGDSSQTGLDALLGILYDFEIVLPNNLGEFQFDGYLADFSIDPTVDDRIRFTGTLRITGKPSFTP